MSNQVGLILKKDPFRRELQKITKNTRIMSVQEIADSGHIIKEHTYLKVPFDEGYLVEGFNQQLQVRSGTIYQIKVTYSAETNPFTDFDYAYIQEVKDYNHPKRGQQYYLRDGMKESESEILNNMENKWEKILMTGAYW